MAYSKSAKPTAATYRCRALVLIEACESGIAIAEAAGHKKLATKFKNTLAWANDIQSAIAAGVR